MSDLDLTEAVEAAASVIDGRASRDLSGFNLRNNATYRRTLARQVLDAAAPLIEAQVRAQIAASIDESAGVAAKKRDAHRAIALEREAGSPGRERHMRTAHAFREQADALWGAASIARGDS